MSGDVVCLSWSWSCLPYSTFVVWLYPRDQWGTKGLGTRGEDLPHATHLSYRVSGTEHPCVFVVPLLSIDRSYSGETRDCLLPRSLERVKKHGNCAPTRKDETFHAIMQAYQVDKQKKKREKKGKKQGG